MTAWTPSSGDGGVRLRRRFLVILTAYSSKWQRYWFWKNAWEQECLGVKLGVMHFILAKQHVHTWHCHLNIWLARLLNSLDGLLTYGDHNIRLWPAFSYFHDVYPAPLSIFAKAQPIFAQTGYRDFDVDIFNLHSTLAFPPTLAELNTEVLEAYLWWSKEKHDCFVVPQAGLKDPIGPVLNLRRS